MRQFIFEEENVCVSASAGSRPVVSVHGRGEDIRIRPVGGEEFWSVW